MTLVLENVKEEFLPSIKEFSQSIGAKCKIQNTESKNKKSTIITKSTKRTREWRV